MLMLVIILFGEGSPIAEAIRSFEFILRIFASQVAKSLYPDVVPLDSN